jgi:hypothetical protein
MTMTLAALLVASGAPAYGDAFDQYRTQCTAAELTAVNDAISKAKQLAQKAAAELPPTNSAGGARFKKWFGGPDGDYDPVVKDIYNEIALKALFQKIWCLVPNSNTPDEWFKTNAFIPKGSAGEIFILPNFFSYKTTGPQSRGGTIVHELSHQSSKRSIVDDGEYGPEKAKARASSSVLARKTADNYKYFAEDVVYGVP